MNILMCNYGEQWLRGQELALLDLLKTLKPGPNSFALWNNNEALAKEVEQLGIPTVTQNFKNYLTWSSGPFDPKHYASLVRDGVRLIRKFKINVVHSNGLGPCQWLMPACWLTNVPLVAHLHMTYLKRNRLIMGGIWADRLVGVSQACVEPFLADGVPTDRIKVIHNGVDAGELKRLAESCSWQPPEISPEKTPLLVIASLERRKGIDVLLDACRQISSLADRYQLLIAGDGPARDELRDASHGLPVTFLGELSRPQVLKLLAATQGVLILPSRAEGFPISILEAAVFSRPAIVTRIGGMPEFVRHEYNGFVIEPNDSRKLAAHLTQLLRDRELLARLGDHAKRRSDEFSLGNMGASFSELYRDLEKSPVTLRVLKAPVRAWHWYRSAHA